MTVDKDRKIVAIQYNLLNLPDVIQFSNGNQIKNRYMADGRKLGTEYFTQLTSIQPLAEGTVLNQVYQANVVDQVGTAYVGNFEYKTYWNVPNYITLKKVFNAEGYVDEYSNNQTYSGYVYYRKDHLGNNREVWRAGKPGGAAATTLQRTWYYPSGLPWNYTTGTGASVQSYKYNSKEFIEMHGFDTYDYSARMMYPAIGGRFMTVDPMAEKYYSISPYAYCAGNPVNRIDPDGKKVVIIGTAKYRKQVMNDLKQIAKDNSDVGKMVNNLIKSPKNHIVEMPKGNDGYNYTEYNDKEAKDGTPQGSKIGYDPNKKETKSGDIRTPRVGFAHELQHSSDVDKGKMDTETKTETGVPVNEVDAVNTENKIREKTGDEKRTTYGGKKISKVWLDN